MSNAAVSPRSTFVPDWSFAEKFRKARKISGMEQREFATALGLTSSTVASYETGRSAPRFRDATGLAKKIQMLTSIDYRWFLDLPTPGDGVGPAGIEPTTSTVEGSRLVLFPDRADRGERKQVSPSPVVYLASRRAGAVA